MLRVSTEIAKFFLANNIKEDMNTCEMLQDFLRENFQFRDDVLQIFNGNYRAVNKLY